MYVRPKEREFSGLVPGSKVDPDRLVSATRPILTPRRDLILTIDEGDVSTVLYERTDTHGVVGDGTTVPDTDGRPSRWVLPSLRHTPAPSSAPRPTLPSDRQRVGLRATDLFQRAMYPVRGS